MNSFAQTGISDGLNYRIDFDKRRALARESYYDDVEKIKSKYHQLKQLHMYQTSYSEVANGWHKVIVTNGYDFFETRQVFVQNGNILKYLNDKQKQLSILSGGRIIDQKTVLAVNKEDNILEVFFGF